MASRNGINWQPIHISPSVSFLAMFSTMFHKFPHTTPIVISNFSVIQIPLFSTSGCSFFTYFLGLMFLINEIFLWNAWAVSRCPVVKLHTFKIAFSFTVLLFFSWKQTESTMLPLFRTFNFRTCNILAAVCKGQITYWWFIKTPSHDNTTIMRTKKNKMVFWGQDENKRWLCLVRYKKIRQKVELLYRLHEIFHEVIYGQETSQAINIYQIQEWNITYSVTGQWKMLKQL